MAWDDDWKTALGNLGIPTDRVKLVERNCELKGKLIARGNAIQGVREAHHEAYEHVGPLDACESGACSGLALILKQTEAS